MGEKKEILFKKGVKIQNLNRIAIPKELLENLNLKVGDEIKILFNPDDSSIIIKKENKK